TSLSERFPIYPRSCLLCPCTEPTSMPDQIRTSPKRLTRILHEIAFRPPMSTYRAYATPLTNHEKRLGRFFGEHVEVSPFEKKMTSHLFKCTQVLLLFVVLITWRI